MSVTANPNPDWYPDPTGRFEQRYWDGSQWTEHVTSAGQQRTDPLPGGPAEPAATTGDLPGLGDTAAGAGTPPGAEPAAASAPYAAAATPAAEPAVAAGPAPEWYPDPTGRYEQRYWDGTQWTEHVTAAGQQGVDPLPDEAGSEGDEGPAATEEAAEATTDIPAGASPFAAAGTAAAPAHPEDYVLNDEGSLVRAAETQTTGGAPGAEGDGAAATGPAPEWYPDPTGRQELRYWDGAQWTEHVSSAGRQFVDPIT